MSELEIWVDPPLLLLLQVFLLWPAQQIPTGTMMLQFLRVVGQECFGVGGQQLACQRGGLSLPPLACTLCLPPWHRHAHNCILGCHHPPLWPVSLLQQLNCPLSYYRLLGGKTANWDPLPAVHDQLPWVLLKAGPCIYLIRLRYTGILQSLFEDTILYKIFFWGTTGCPKKMQDSMHGHDEAAK